MLNLVGLGAIIFRQIKKPAASERGRLMAEWASAPNMTKVSQIARF